MTMITLLRPACSCGDVTQLQLPADSADLVFSNWLLMYLSDDEVSALAHGMLSWVAEGCSVFFRESCFRQSGDRQRNNNPTHYRCIVNMQALIHRRKAAYIVCSRLMTSFLQHQ